MDFAEVEAPLFHAVRRAQQTKLCEDEHGELCKLLARRIALCKERCDSWAVDVASLSTGQEWFEQELFSQPEPEAVDELPDKYDLVMHLPEQWKFKLDPNLIGEKQQWFRIDHDDLGWKQIRVGEFWDKQGYPDYDGCRLVSPERQAAGRAGRKEDRALVRRRRRKRQGLRQRPARRRVRHRPLGLGQAFRHQRHRSDQARPGEPDRRSRDRHCKGGRTVEAG